MKRSSSPSKRFWRHCPPAGLLLVLFCLLSLPYAGSAQGKDIVINLAPIDGLQLSPDNLFSFGIQSGMPGSVNAAVKGTLRYRQSGLSFSYTFNTVLRPGMNMPDGNAIHPVWTFSSGAFRELFQDYKCLPEGTYEYCVSVAPLNAAGEHGTGGESSECLYGKSEDIFLINLVSPENNAKLYEHYPVFSWVVNYPFASQLTYRIRVAEIKEGQNTVGALTRNNPVYQESNLPQTTTTYPVYGTPLKTFQPYGWTVDAYYKGILLGGAEPWKFTIVEDSEMASVPRETSFLDMKREAGGNLVYAVGVLKLKYVLEDYKSDLLTLQLTDGTQEIKLPADTLSAVRGDNRYSLDLSENPRLVHKKQYSLYVASANGEHYKVVFTYINPDFLK